MAAATPHSAAQSSGRKQLQSCQRYEDGIAEKFIWIYVFADGDGTVHRVESPNEQAINLEDLPECPINIRRYAPLWLPCWTQWHSESPSNTNVFVKSPSFLLPPSEGVYQQEGTVRELCMGEFLKQHPHPNICPYLGCVVDEGYVTGVVHARMQYTLSSLTRQERATRSEKILGDIRAAVDHLRKLGLIYIDIKPANIMWSGERWCLIDFSECFAPGTRFDFSFGTIGWVDQDIRIVDDALLESLMNKLKLYVETGKEPEVEIW